MKLIHSSNKVYFIVRLQGFQNLVGVFRDNLYMITY